VFPEQPEPPMKDFFVSFNSADKAWADWIAWTLEEAGYQVVYQRLCRDQGPRAPCAGKVQTVSGEELERQVQELFK
jgi:hypothetical protein